MTDAVEGMLRVDADYDFVIVPGIVLLAVTPCTPGTETGSRNGSDHRHRNGTADTDPH